MAEYDGSIRIGVKMELDNAQKQVSQLEKQFTTQTRAVEKQAQAVEKLRGQYEQLVANTAMPEGAQRLAEHFAAARAEAARLDQQIQALKASETAGTASPEDAARIQELTAKMNEADLRADTLRQQLEAMNVNPKALDKMDRLAGSLGEADAKLLGLQQQAGDTGGQLSAAQRHAAELAARLQDIAGSASVADQHIVDLQKELETLKARKKDLEAAGVGLGYEEYDQLTARIQEINNALSEYRKGLQGAGGEESAAAGRLAGLKSAMERTAASIINGSRKAGSAVGGLRKNVNKLGKERGFSKAADAAGKLFNRIKRLVVSAFFFRIISRQLRKLVQNLGKYMLVNREFTQALSGLKSNLLTAFQPVYDSVMPALAKLMESLEAVTAKFAVFMATIFGTTASQAQKDADALYEEAIATEELGDAAEKTKKKQKDMLASFDTIEKLGTKDEEDENKTRPKFDTDFSQVQAPQWLLNFWKVFQDGWAQFGEPTMAAFRNAVQAIKDLIAALAEAFLNVWTGGTGLEFLGRIHQLLQTIFGIVADIAGAFKTAWDVKGEEVLGAFFYMLNSILDLIISIGSSFREAWNDGYGVTICETILSIFQNIFTIVGNLANRLREAWEANGNGVAIWRSILDIIQDILDCFNEITGATATWTETLNLEPLVSGFRHLLEALEPVIDLILGGLSWAWENILLPLAGWFIEDAAPKSLEALAYALGGLVELLEAVGNLIQSMWPIIQPVAEFIGRVLVGAIQALGEVIELVMQIVAAFINAIAQLISAITGANTSVGNLGSFMGMSGSGGRSYSPARSMPTAYSAAALMDNYPHLASGAVIAPNHEFLAVLGDQRSGTNIETPLATMKQAFLEAIGESGLLSSAGGGGMGAAEMIVDGATFARLIYPYLQSNQARIGVNLVTGG